MKRKVFAGSAVAAALLFQLTAVSFPAYAAEYDAVQKEEFVSSFSDAETKQVAQYLVDNGLSLEESKDLMKTYEKGLAIIARESENSGIAMYDLEDSADEEIHIDAPFYSETNLASTDHYIAVINTNVDRNVRGCLDFLFHEKYSYYDNEVLYFLNNDTNISKLLPIYEDSDLSLTYKLITDGTYTGTDIMCLVKVGTGINTFSESDLRNSISMVDTSHIGGFKMHTFALGDIDHNGIVNEADSTYLMKFLVHLSLEFSYNSGTDDTSSLMNIAAMNFNLDDKVDLEDAISLNRYIANSENATTLTFSYNFISEEPMEWVGDEYDDEFLTNIYAGTSTSTVLRESTNTSTWHRTNITNFYGGDNTMYETQWKTVTIDVEQYAGKAIKLEFNVNNVGDNTYNSAVLIDNVLVA